MQFYSGGLPMQAQDCDFIYTPGVVRLEKKDGQFSGRWGIGRPDVTTITIDPDSPIVLEKDGFTLLTIKICPNASTFMARPVEDTQDIINVLGGLSTQLDKIRHDERFCAEIARATNSVAQKQQHGLPVMVVLKFKNKQRGECRCFHGYGLTNHGDIVNDQITTYGSKVKGIGGVDEGWQMVLMFPTDEATSRFVAIPTDRENFIQLAIDGLKQQLEVARKYEQARTDKLRFQADLG